MVLKVLIGKGNISSPKDWRTEFTIEIIINSTIAKYGWRPYLFPPKSLPVEKAEEICKAAESMDYGSAEERVAAMLHVVHLMNKYHVDYRGLIPMGLAQ